MEYLYREESALIRKCMYEVQNEVGLGKQERAYHRACELWLRDNQISHMSKKLHSVELNGEIAHTLIPDLVLWDCIRTSR